MLTSAVHIEILVIPVPVYLGRLRIAPDTAAALAMIGGALIALEGLLFTYGDGNAVVGVLLGAAILVAAFVARGRPQQRTALGALTALLGAASFVFISGFYVGAALAIFGGVLLATSGPAPFTIDRPAPVTARDLGPPCPRCARHIPTWTSQCPYCGFPDPATE